MNCPVCGAMVPDGQAVCPACGAALQQMYQQPQQPQQQMYQQPQQQMYQQPQQQPQQQMYQQPQQQMYQQPQQPQQQMYQQPQQQPQQQMYQQPQQQMYQQQPMYQQPQQMYQGYQPRMGGASMPAGINIFAIVSLAGALLLFFTPLMSWATVSVWGMKVSTNIFKLEKGIETFSGIMIMILAAGLIFLSISELIPALQNMKSRIPAIVEIIVVAVTIVIVLIATIFVMNSSDKKEIVDYGGKAYRSIGCWLAWICALVAGVNPVMKLVKK